MKEIRRKLAIERAFIADMKMSLGSLLSRRPEIGDKEYFNERHQLVFALSKAQEDRDTLTAQFEHLRRKVVM
jgi:hypothetical protein